LIGICPMKIGLEMLLRVLIRSITRNSIHSYPCQLRHGMARS
jgi:hypothetical protein